MTRTRHGPDGRGADPVLDGWRLLTEGRWLDARRAFEAALESTSTAQALEGLSWAAWWLDDADTVFASREQAYRLYRKGGDAAGAARMATWLAIDHLDFRGAMAVANGWVGRARRLLEPLEPGAEHGWLTFLDGYIALVSGDFDAAADCGRRASAAGRDLGVADLEMLGLALEGTTLVSRGRVGQGMRCLDEATATALEGEAEIPISHAWACCFLVTACIAVRDFGRALDWCDRIAAFADRYGSRYMLAFCRSEYAAIDLWRGRWSEAEALLDASLEDFMRSRPAMVGGTLTALAELRRRQGRREESLALLKRAGATTSAQLCHGRLALDRGDAGHAAELAERCLRQLPDNRRLDRIPALELLVRARILRGEFERAAVAADTLRAIAGEVGTEPLAACADLCEGMLAAARGEHGRAQPLLEDAVDRFERSGGSFEAAEGRLELATTLLALERPDSARREAGAALDCLAGLGAVTAVERAHRIVASCGGGPSPAGVTRRERQVLALVVEGLTNREIAARLHVSEHTVHRHVTNLLRKLDLPSRTAAAAWAVRSGLLGTGSE